MQHSLVFYFDGCRVGEDEHFGEEFLVDAWGRWVWVGWGGGGGREEDHALADVLSSYALQGEGGGLACRSGEHGEAFPLDAADDGGCELPQGVRAD